MSYPFKINGYIYSRKTKVGFLRMQRMGIPRPLFSLEDRLAKLLIARYKALTRKLLKEIKAKCSQSDIVLDAAADDDGLESLLKFFDDMGKELARENEELSARLNLNTVTNSLEHEWFDGGEQEETGYFMAKLDDVFKAEQKDYLQRLFSDADPKTANILQTFSIDKQKFFNDNMEAVRKLYIDNSIERIRGEESLIKRRILQRITDYAMGKNDALEIADLVKEGYESSDSLSRLFARDQMARFNKACTLATFKSAAVTKVKWVTANDGRVRNKSYIDKRGRLHRAHTELQGQVFDINDLPLEIDDYNCRCGLVPVEWADD